MLQPCVTEKQMKFSQEGQEKANDETNQCIQLGKSNQAVTNGRNYDLLLLTIWAYYLENRSRGRPMTIVYNP